MDAVDVLEGAFADPVTECVEVALENMKVVNLQPGDVIVMMHPGVLSDAATENITESVRGVFGDHKVVILEEGMTMSLIREGGS